MATVALVLVCVLGLASGAPLKTFDQRQHGDLNIHAQLDNIIIMFIPSSSVNLLELAGKTKYSGEKPGKGSLLQIFQKPHKADIDRYEIVNDVPETEADVKPSSQSDPQDVVKTEIVMPIITSQQVALNHEAQTDEKAEEVVAVVEEMKKDTAEKTNAPGKIEGVETNPTKEQSAVSGTVDIVVRTKPDPLPTPPGEKDSPKLGTEIKRVEDSKESEEKASAPKPNLELSSELDKESSKKEKFTEKVNAPSPPKEESSHEEISEESSESGEPSIKDLLRPVATQDEKADATTSKKIIAESTKKVEQHPPSDDVKTAETVRLQGSRKEKVIRYKPESKWAPELMSLLGPPKTKDLEERRFSSLCSPGVWDTELKTCIMPGETRSRHELARFLEAMRFGIALPAQ